jgi:hypothetical protein
VDGSGGQNLVSATAFVLIMAASVVAIVVFRLR